MRAIELLRARGRRADALVRRAPGRVGGRARLRPARRRASSACWSRASRAAASRPSARALEAGWGARVTEAMGIGDIGVVAVGRVRASRTACTSARAASSTPSSIDPATGAALELDDGARGELVLTHLRHRAAPLLRFRTRDHVAVRHGPCPCGRTGPRVRCIGRTDDMLIVRGVNVFPSAVREVVSAFAPRSAATSSSGRRRPGVKQDPPLPVERRARARRDGRRRARRRDPRAAARACSSSRRAVELVPWGSLQRSEYKSKLVER